MQQRTYLAFAATALVLCGALTDLRAASEERREISILYTINNQGYIEPCG